MKNIKQLNLAFVFKQVSYVTLYAYQKTWAQVWVESEES